MPRRLVLFGAPLALGVLEIFHPRGQEPFATIADNVTLWLVVHLVQLPLFALVALAVYLLVSGLNGVAAVVSRVAMAVFVVFYTALDSIAGIAAGILVGQARGLSPQARQTVAGLVDSFSASFSAPFAHGGGPIFIVTVLGGLGWVVGVIAAAVACARAGAPLAATVPVGLAAVFVAHDAPIAPAAMACLLGGAIYTELTTATRTTSIR